MANDQTIAVALVRGDSLNEWEGKAWEHLGDTFRVTGFCSRKNLYSYKNLSYPVVALPCTTDRVLTRLWGKFTAARFQRMNGLEQKLATFQIAHTAEIYYYYTLQAVRAKKQNHRLRVVTTVWDNSFGRFEHNYWPGFKVPPRYWRERIKGIIAEVCSGVDFFLPVSPYSAALLHDYGVKENKMKVITPALVSAESAQTDVLLDELQIRGRELYLVVNRMVKEKGIYDVLYAWKRYIRSASAGNKVLLMIGSGSERENAMRLVNEWGLTAQIRFVSQLPNQQLRQLYRSARCLVLASLPTPVWQEQFGYVLAEAMNAGCPVVAARSGAIPEVVEDAGILFAPGNPLDLYVALCAVDDEQRYAQLKRNAQRVAAKFSLETFIHELTSVYKSLV